MNKPSELTQYFQYWEITKDLINQCIDIILNFSKSGHLGFSRSKVHARVTTLLFGTMRWDIHDPDNIFAGDWALQSCYLCNLSINELSSSN